MRESETGEPISTKFTPKSVGDFRISGEIQLLEMCPSGVEEPEVGFGGDLGVGYGDSDLESGLNGDSFGMPVDFDQGSGGIEADGFVFH